MKPHHVLFALGLALCLLPASSGNARGEKAVPVHLVTHLPHASAINTLAASRDGRVAVQL